LTLGLRASQRRHVSASVGVTPISRVPGRPPPARDELTPIRNVLAAAYHNEGEDRQTGALPLSREDLVALRDAIDAVLAWPDSVPAEMARWLAPEAAKPGNGLDHAPAPVASTPTRVGQARRGKAAKAQAGEQAPRRDGIEPRRERQCAGQGRRHEPVDRR